MDGLNCRSSANGFTLFEVVVAVGILTAGIVAVLQAVRYAAHQAALANDYVAAILLAEDMLSELELKEKQMTLAPGLIKGQSDRLDWEYDIHAHPESEGVYDVVFNTSWLRHGKKEQLTFETYAAK